MKFLLMCLICLSLFGCERITTSAIESSLNTLITMYCDDDNRDDREELLSKIRRHIPSYPEGGLCNPLSNPQPFVRNLFD